MRMIDPDFETIPHPLWRTTLCLGDVDALALEDGFSEALGESVVSVFLQNKDATDGNDWDLIITTIGAPDLGDMHTRLAAVHPVKKEDLKAEKLPEKDWLRHVHDNFPPVTIGKFFVYGSHYEGDVPANLTPLKIDAATAFGSGEHETTKGCLEALQALADGAEHASPLHILDMGCGSGILAIGAAKIWPDAKLTAIDIDPESVIVTQRHAQMNGAEKNIVQEAGDGYASPLCQHNAPYDIIIANILAGPLIDMAGDLNKALKSGGYCVLSGLLARQKDDVVNAHVAQGLTLQNVIEIGDWRTLVLQKG